VTDNYGYQYQSQTTKNKLGFNFDFGTLAQKAANQAGLFDFN
jgi:hypothetical protein